MRHEEPFRDLPVREAGGGECGDLPLLGSEVSRSKILTGAGGTQFVTGPGRPWLGVQMLKGIECRTEMPPRFTGRARSSQALTVGELDASLVERPVSCFRDGQCLFEQLESLAVEACDGGGSEREESEPRRQSRNARVADGIAMRDGLSVVMGADSRLDKIKRRQDCLRDIRREAAWRADPRQLLIGFLEVRLPERDPCPHLPCIPLNNYRSPMGGPPIHCVGQRPSLGVVAAVSGD